MCGWFETSFHHDKQIAFVGNLGVYIFNWIAGHSKTDLFPRNKAEILVLMLSLYFLPDLITAYVQRKFLQYDHDETHPSLKQGKD